MPVTCTAVTSSSVGLRSGSIGGVSVYRVPAGQLAALQLVPHGRKWPPLVPARSSKPTTPSPAPARPRPVVHGDGRRRAPRWTWKEYVVPGELWGRPQVVLDGQSHLGRRGPQEGDLGLGIDADGVGPPGGEDPVDRGRRGREGRSPPLQPRQRSRRRGRFPAARRRARRWRGRSTRPTEVPWKLKGTRDRTGPRRPRHRARPRAGGDCQAGTEVSVRGVEPTSGA